MIRKIYWNFIITFNVVFWSCNIITCITPRDINLSPLHIYTKYKLETVCTDYEDITGELIMAKSQARYKIENSKTINNKKELLERISNVSVKKHHSYHSPFFFNDGYKMSYTYNFYSNTDYIVVCEDRIDDYTKEFYHELNHLIDLHKNTDVDIDAGDLIIKGISQLEYNSYYSHWRLGHEISSTFYNNYSKNSSYYTSDVEVYARMSSLKNTLVIYGLLNIDDVMTIEHVNVFMYIMNNRLLNDHEYMNEIYEFDFMPILPMIDWSRTDILATM